MKRDIDQVLRRGIQAKQLAVRHVREPRERMPVGRVEGGKSPGDIAELQSCADMNVLRDVLGVIEVKEFVMPDAAIQQNRSEHEE